MEINKLRPIILSIALLIGFSILMMFTLTYLIQRYSSTCGCAYTLPIVIILLSGTGIVVGALTYYFLSGSFEEKRKKFNENKKQVLNFLEKDEREIINILIKNNGSISQSDLAKKIGFDRVKVFRVIEKLEQKKIIIKEKTGKTNLIILKPEIKQVLL